MKPTQIVEAVLFSSDAPLKAEEIARADESLDEDVVEEALRSLRSEYAETERAFQIVEVAEGYQILTLPEFVGYLERFDTVPRPSRLSGPALETLAIIAYRQPMGRIEIEYIRGVSSSGVIRTLQDRGLVDVVGRAEGLGRPLLYGTTPRFLEHFGFASMDDLPRPEELPVVLRDRVPLDEDEAGEDGVDPAQTSLDVEGASSPTAGPGEGRAIEAEPGEGGGTAHAGSDAEADDGGMDEEVRAAGADAEAGVEERAALADPDVDADAAGGRREPSDG